MLSFDRTFLGADGISADKGLTTTDMASAKIKEAVIDKAKIVNIIADFSKIGKVSLVPHSKINQKKNIRIITDFKADKKELKKLKDMGIEVKIVYPRN